MYEIYHWISLCDFYSIYVFHLYNRYFVTLLQLSGQGWVGLTTDFIFVMFVAFVMV